SIGLYIRGNVVFATGLEIIGYRTGVDWGGSVGNILGGNIAGSPGFLTDKAMILSVRQFHASNIYIERLSTPAGGVPQDSHAIDIEGGGVYSFEGIHFADGNLRVNAAV